MFKLAVITSAAANCGCKCVRRHMGSEKRTAWWNPKVKEAIHAKKTVLKAWLTNKSSEQLCMQYSAAHKTVAIIVNQSKEKLWKEFGQKLDTDYNSANKIFWQTICYLHGKQIPPANFIQNTNDVILKH